MPVIQQKLLRLPAVLERLGVGRSTFLRMVARGEFSPAVKVTGRCRAWPESAINSWIEARCDSVSPKK